MIWVVGLLIVVVVIATTLIVKSLHRILRVVADIHVDVLALRHNSGTTGRMI